MSEGFNKFRKELNSGLEKKRWSAKSITALVLFGAIIAVFAFFGMPNRMNNQGSSNMSAAAQVNHALIPLSDLRNESARMEQMYAPLFGNNGMGDAQRQFVRQQALESLIVQELSSQMANKAGILATDPEIQEVIVKEIPAFQQNGRFQRDLYYQILEANHLTPIEFESRLRKEKVNMRTQKLFQSVSLPLNMEIEKLKALQDHKLNVAFAKVDKEKVVQAAQVTDAEIKSKLANPDFEKKVQEYYNSNKAEFNVEPQVHAQHILIKTDKDSVKAKAEIDDLKKRAAKEDFSKLASQYSEDTGSKAKGGDLGYFTKGKMVPEFETAAFNQKVGEVGDVIRSPFGYHLIKVLDRKEGKQKSLDEVRHEIAHKLIATEAYDSELKALEEALAKGDAAGVDAQVKKMGGTWEETGFFDLTADQVPKLMSPEASKAAFEVTEAKPLYPKVVRDGPEKFVIKLKGTKTEASPAGEKILETVSRERSSDLFRSWIEDGKKTARIERNMDAVSGKQ